MTSALRSNEPIATFKGFDVSPAITAPISASRSGRQELINMDRRPQSEPAGWVEIDLKQFRRNWESINRYKPENVRIAYVVKDDGYGHGAEPLAKIAAEFGVEMFVAASVGEGFEIRAAVDQPILLLGERNPEEYRTC